MEYGKRTPVMKRKPSVVIAIGMPKPDLKEQVAKKMDEEPEEADLTCPKCGMALADTPENREYAAMRGEEMEESDEASEDEDED